MSRNMAVSLTLEQVRNRTKTVTRRTGTSWASARKNGVQATPEVIDAAIVTLVVPPYVRDAAVTVRPATAWDIDGYTVLVWAAGPPGQPAPYAECECPYEDGPCEHLLIALAGTSPNRPDSH